MLWDNTLHNAATAASFNQDCAFVLGLESMLLRDPPQILFNSIDPTQTLSTSDPGAVWQWLYSCAAGVPDLAGGACAWGCAGAASGVAMEML